MPFAHDYVVYTRSSVASAARPTEQTCIENIMLRCLGSKRRFNAVKWPRQPWSANDYGTCNLSTCASEYGVSHGLRTKVASLQPRVLGHIQSRRDEPSSHRDFSADAHPWLRPKTAHESLHRLSSCLSSNSIILGLEKSKPSPSLRRSISAIDRITATTSTCNGRQPGGTQHGAATFAAAPSSSGNTVPCPIGSTLVLDLRQSSRDVSLVANDDPSNLMFVTWPKGEAAHVQTPLADRLVLTPARHGPQLVLQIPPRYCNLEVHNAGGNVHVEAVKEGTLAVDSGGGDVKIDSMAGTFAEIQTRGGAVSGKITAGKVYINTDSKNNNGSGEVNLSKLLSKEAVILTRDLVEDQVSAVAAYPEATWGDVTVTALYSDVAHIRTGGTPVSVNTLACSKDGSMVTDGGPVSIGCLDGTMRICSGGGDVDIAVQKNVTAIHVNSMPKFDEGDPVSVAAAAKGGTIHCHVDPSVQALAALQCGDLNIDESLPFKVLEVKAKMVKGRLGPVPDEVTAAAATATAATVSPTQAAAMDADTERSNITDKGSTTGTAPPSPVDESAATNCDGTATTATGAKPVPQDLLEFSQSDNARVTTTADAIAAEAAAAADPAVLKHIVLDAGDDGAVRLTASSWADTVRARMAG